jgi:hypothetical protein
MVEGLRKSVIKSTREAKKSSSTYFGEISKAWCVAEVEFPSREKSEALSLRIGSAMK